MSEQTAKVYLLANALAYHRNYTYCRCLLVNHTDGSLVGNDSANCCGWRVARNGNHVESYRAYARHGLEFLDGERTGLNSINHALVFAHRDERSAESANIRRCHHSALLYLVVEQGEGCRCTRRAGMFKTDGFEDVGNAVAHRRSWRKREIDDSERNTQTARCLLSHELTHACNLEGCLLDSLAKHLEVGILYLLKSVLNHSRTANAHVDNSLSLRHSVECSSHKRIIVGRVAQNNKFGASQRVVLLGALGCSLHNLAHYLYGIHVYACLCRAYVYRAADALGTCHSLGNGAHKQFVALGHSLCHDSRISAKEVNAHVLSHLVERYGNLHIVFGRMACACTYNGNRGDGDSLVYNRNAVLARYSLASCHKVFGKRCYLGSDVTAEFFEVGVAAVKQTDSHGDGSDIEILVLNHRVGFCNFVYIYHIFAVFLSNYQMRCILLKISSRWHLMITPSSSPILLRSVEISS